MRRPWRQRLGDALSQLANVALLNGAPDESLSARAYRESRRGAKGWQRAMRLINAAFFWQANHCRGAYHADLARCRARLAEAAAPPERPGSNPTINRPRAGFFVPAEKE